MHLIIIKIVAFYILSTTSEIEVIVHTLRSDRGLVAMVLHTIPKAFPSDASKGYRIVFAPISAKTSQYTFKDIPPGEYAVSVFHDEDGDKKLKTNMFGIPKEGWGASNDAKGILGPPKFSDAKFSVKASGRVSQRIKINY